MILFNSDFSEAFDFGMAARPASMAFWKLPSLKAISALKYDNLSEYFSSPSTFWKYLLAS